MNAKALVVLAWLGLSGYVVFRDWSADKEKALQELTGIWLLSVIALVLSEASDNLGLIAELILVADVLIQPGSSNAGQSFAATMSKVLPAPKPAAAPTTTGVVV